MTPTVLRDQFRGMGTNVVVEVVGGSPGHLALARDRLAFLEARWSRFRPSSDLSRLNRAEGEPTPVDTSTIRLLEAMVHAFTLTDGAFDPTLLAPLVRLGYDASVHDPSAVTELPPGVQSRGFVRGLVIDVNESTARLPLGTAVDAGGIGKGLAADIVAEQLIDGGASGAMIDIGHDVRVVGDGPHDGCWLVNVDAALQPEVPVATVRLCDGALGSSGTLRRTWMTADGHPAHHVLDPATTRPLLTGFDAAVHSTVLAPTAVAAEMHSTLALVRGARRALPRLDEEGMPARVVDGEGRTYTNRSWESVVSTGG